MSIKFRFYDTVAENYITTCFDQVLVDGNGDVKWFSWKSLEDARHRIIAEQWSGLKDANGDDVYVGDKLGGGHSEPREVYFQDGSFKFRDNDSNQADQILVPFTCSKLSVMGNIHEE